MTAIEPSEARAAATASAARTTAPLAEALVEHGRRAGRGIM